MFLELPVDNGKTVLVALNKIIYISKSHSNDKKMKIFLLGDEYIVVDVEYEALINILNQAGSVMKEVDYD